MSSAKPKLAPAADPKSGNLSIARMLWKQRYVILLAWIILTALTVALVHALPTQYTSEALILVESQKIPEALVASTANVDLQDRLATIRQEVLSSTRLQKIIDKFSLYPAEKGKSTHDEIVEIMRKDIKITLEKGWSRNQPGAFRISYTSTDRTKVEPVANELSNLFIEENLHSRETQAFGTKEFLQTQLEQAKKNLEEQEAKLSKYKLEHNGDLPEQEGSLMGKLERCNIELQASHDAINRIEQSKNVLEGEIASAEAYRSAILSGALDSTPAAASAGNASSALAGQLKQTAEKPSQRLRRQLEELRLRYTPDYPAVKELQLQLNEALKQEEQQEKEQRKLEDAARAQEEARRAAEKARPNSVAVAAARTRPEVAQLLMREQERITLLKTQLANADAEVANLKQKQEDLSAKIAELQERIEQIPIRQQEMAGLLRDYDISSANYRSLLSKDFTADMASDMEKRQKSERFMVLDPARPPEKPSKPNRPLFNSIAIFVSLLLGIAVGFGLEWKKNVFLGEWELPVGTPILGRVPPIRTLRSDSEPPESSRGAAPFRFKLRIRWVYPVIVSLTVLLLIGLWLKK